MGLSGHFICRDDADIAIHFQDSQFNFRDLFDAMFMYSLFQLVIRDLDFFEHIRQDSSVFYQDIRPVFYQFFDFFIFKNKFFQDKISQKQNDGRNQASLKAAVGTYHGILYGITDEKQEDDVAGIKLW